MILMDNISAEPIADKTKIQNYIETLKKIEKHIQVPFIQTVLQREGYKLENEQHYLTQFWNETINENGFRLDLVYSLSDDMKIIIHSFTKEGSPKTQETTAYVIKGNELMLEYFTNDEEISSDIGFIKNNWNGDVILSTRTQQEYQPWQM